MKKAKSHNSKHRTKLHCIAESRCSLNRRMNRPFMNRSRKTPPYLRLWIKKCACDWCPLVVELFVGLCTHSLWSHLSPKIYYHSEVESVNKQYTLPPQGENEEKRESKQERERKVTVTLTPSPQEEGFLTRLWLFVPYEPSVLTSRA